MSERGIQYRINDQYRNGPRERQWGINVIVVDKLHHYASVSCSRSGLSPADVFAVVHVLHGVKPSVRVNDTGF